jgi:twinkle protein
MTFEDLGIQLKGKTGTIYMVCPKCVDTRKAENRKKTCLTVHNEPGNQWWKCQNCDWKGNLETHQKSQKIYEKAYMPKVRPTIYSPEITLFLTKRGISSSTAFNAGVYETKAKEEQIICYPYYVNHSLRNVMFRRVNYIKGVTEGAREWQIKRTEEVQTESVFWGLDDYDRDHPECIIVEGQTDRLSWLEAGYKNVLSVPMGGINPPKGDTDKKEYEKKFAFINDEFRAITNTSRKFILCTDADDVGIATREAMASIIGKNRCYKVTLPFKYKDSNEVLAGNDNGLQALGIEGIHEVYKTSKPFPIEGIITLMDIRDELILMTKEGPKKGYLCGNKALDPVLSIREKLLMVVTGIAGMGKSTWTRWYTTSLTLNNPDLKWGIYTPENRPMKREFLRICEVKEGRSSWVKHQNCMGPDQLQNAMNWTNDHFYLMAPEHRNYFSFEKEKPKTLKNLFGYIKTLKDRYGITGFVIDAFNKVEHERDSKQAEEQYIGMVLDLILEFLDIEDLMGIIVAHPHKMEAKPTGNFPVPGLFNVKGSSAWSERTDIGIAIHRNKFKQASVVDDEGKKQKTWVRDPYAATLVDINKMKFDELGEETGVEMYLDMRSGYRFVEEPPRYYQEKTKPLIETSTPETFNSETSDDLPF